MRRGVARGLIVVSAVGLPFGCGLFPDLSGLGGDASIGLDAHPSDGNSGGDVVTDSSGADSSADVTADAGFCAGHPGHTFCEDFDEPNFQGRWDGVQTSNNGASLVESPAQFVSPPNSLLVTLPTPANAGGHAYATKHFTTASQLTIQTELLVEPTTPAQLDQLDPLMIVFNPAPAGYDDYEIHIDIATMHLGYVATPSDGGAQVHLDTSFTNPLSSWHNVEVDLTLATGAIKILVDGVQATVWTVAPIGPSAFDLRLGVAASDNVSNATIAETVNVDNVLVDTQ